jgi:hypothetical protein
MSRRTEGSGSRPRSYAQASRQMTGIAPASFASRFANTYVRKLLLRHLAIHKLGQGLVPSRVANGGVLRMVTFQGNEQD